MKSSKYRNTKIIATVGPSTHSYEAVYDLIGHGANGIRLNFSHGTYEERKQQIHWIRKASLEQKKPVAIIQDLQGPKIRLGDFDGVINVQKGQAFQFGYKTDYQRTGVIPIQYDLSKKVERTQRLLLFDGKVQMTITSVRERIIHARAENDGILIQRKGINIPDSDLGGDIITAKDKKDIVFGSTQDIDYVAMSFVQKAADIENLRKRLRAVGSDAKIIAKIETKSSIENIEEILQETDVVMIARGDMATEVPPETVPIIQRRIIGLGIHYKKPTIVATQMLDSMISDPEPTRAEVSDVATAVIVGADCVMLSDETASGKHPTEAVSVMRRVILYTQANSDIKATFPGLAEDTSVQNSISAAIISLAKSVEAEAIVAETKTGATALNIASHRPCASIKAITSNRRIAHQLAIVYGVKSYNHPPNKYGAAKLTDWLVNNKVLKKGDVIVAASGQHPGVVGMTDTIKVRVL